MENVKVVLEDVKNLRSSVRIYWKQQKDFLKITYFSIKQLARKERDEEERRV